VSLQYYWVAVVFITLGTVTAVFYICVNRYLLLFSVYFAQFQLFHVWFLHTVLLNFYDFNQNWFVESYTSLMGINRNLCLLPNFNITRHMMSPHNAYYTFLYLLSNGLFLSVLQSEWDTLHFLYRHYVYHEDGGSCFFTFQMFPPTVFGTAIQKKKKSLHCINLQCNKDFLDKSQVKVS